MNNGNSDLALHQTQAQTKNALSARISSLALTSITPHTQGLLLRMFADPYLLEKQDRLALIDQLRECVSRHPQVSELRVLLGMALCVNLDVHPAIEELKESVKLSPNSFIAQLKLGELWMRLRVVDQAEERPRFSSHCCWQSFCRRASWRRPCAVASPFPPSWESCWSECCSAPAR